jgi:tetratricopeptide (TPR) repeat protein
VEDGAALGLESVQIDLAIGGRFQIAKTLSNVALCFAGAGDYDRALSYLNRARESHERYGEHDSRADTLLATAEVLIERGELDKAQTLIGDASALTQVTESAYDSIHERLLRAVLAYEMGDARTAVQRAFEARQAAEAQAYAAFHFYAMAVEAAARVGAGEVHTGVLLATTALGAIETLQGSEYGLQTRALCCDALKRAGSPQAEELRLRALRHVERLQRSLRDGELRNKFLRRRAVISLMGPSGELFGRPSGSTETGQRRSDAPRPEAPRLPELGEHS